MRTPVFAAAAVFLGLWTAPAFAATRTFVEADGCVSMEAENYTKLTKGWKKGTGESASGDAYLIATQKRSKNARVEYRIRFTRKGWYRVWIRASSTSHGDNDCYVFLDGKPGSVPDGSGKWLKAEGAKTDARSFSRWQSTAKAYHYSGSIRRNGCHVNVATAGDHTLQLGSRSKDFKLDKIVLLLKDEKHPKLSGTGPKETILE